MRVLSGMLALGVIAFLLFTAGAMVGYTSAVAGQVERCTEMTEDQTAYVAGLRVVAAQSLVVGEAWRLAALKAIDAQYGPFPEGAAP